MTARSHTRRNRATKRREAARRRLAAARFGTTPRRPRDESHHEENHRD